jgi:hypothetical protein
VGEYQEAEGGKGLSGRGWDKFSLALRERGSGRRRGRLVGPGSLVGIVLREMVVRIKSYFLF